MLNGNAYTACIKARHSILSWASSSHLPPLQTSHLKSIFTPFCNLFIESRITNTLYSAVCVLSLPPMSQSKAQLIAARSILRS